MASVSFQALLTSWDVLNANLKAHLQALPDLQPGQKQFEGMINEGLALARQQSQLTANLRDLVVQRNDLTKRGNHLREFLVAGLRHQLGADSQKLIEFEVRPRIRRRKTPSEPATSPDPVSPAQEEALA